MPTLQGAVTRLVIDKGFGFIRAEHSTTEYFFHRSACAPGAFDVMHEGLRVSFDAGQGPKGPRAEHVVEHDHEETR